MIISDDDYAIAHYGVLRKSGRYPWGSGGPEHASNKGFLQMVDSMKKQGLSETEIAKGLDITTTQLRAAKSIAKNEEKQSEIGMAQRLKDKGYSNVAIAQRMDRNESYVRTLLAPGEKDKADVLSATANMLKEQVDTKGYIDVGAGVEYHVGVSTDKLRTAVAVLKEQGYEEHTVLIDQLGTGNKTRTRVLAPPGTQYRDIVANKDKIQSISGYSDDGGRSYTAIKPPLSVDSKRVKVRYDEEGGSDADGVIYVRPGVDDISLGKARYAQVRIAVDGTHYLKGMAIYKDDLPDGVDLMFNTNKKDTGNKLDAMKKMSDDPENPFGAVVRQLTTPDGSKVTSAMNLVNDEGDWEKWSRNLSSQMLSKQSPNLAKTQLDVTHERRQRELDEILSLTNPAVRAKLLESYSDSVDSAAIHLKAAAIPRQKTHVLLPVNQMKETEIYAPNFSNGERVALVRFPHGGTFEIPELTVNNRNPHARKLLGNAPNAVGIHSKVAERLSGADFDGDTVLVIPNNDGKIKSSPPLEGLRNFDPKRSYPPYEGMPKMTPRQKGIQMGKVSNLITDMTIRGANNDELARAVRHSMVVIDAEKHNLNWKESERVNGISALMEKYQNKKTGGASTLISKARSDQRVPHKVLRKAKDGGPIDPATGKKVWVPTGEGYTDPKTGKWTPRTTKSVKLAETDDAHTLSSGTTIEKIYADHSNRMKALANMARKEMVRTKNNPISPSAKVAYANEVSSLNSKLTLALRNAPLERQAQVLANAEVAQKKAANPGMENKEVKKLQYLALKKARARTGATKQTVHITDAEWDAIQAGAISSHKLNQILDHADLDRVKELATPRSKEVMTSAKKALADQLINAGYTQAEAAERLGVSVSTLKSSLSE